MTVVTGRVTRRDKDTTSFETSCFSFFSRVSIIHRAFPARVSVRSPISPRDISAHDAPPLADSSLPSQIFPSRRHVRADTASPGRVSPRKGETAGGINSLYYRRTGKRCRRSERRQGMRWKAGVSAFVGANVRAHARTGHYFGPCCYVTPWRADAK